MFGYAHSLIGDQVFYVALTWAAVQVMSPAHVGLVLVLGSVPRAVLMLAGGVFVDRLGPKRVIVVSDVLRTLVMVGAALALGAGASGTALIATLAAVFGVVEGFFLPAVGAVPPFVADRDGLTRLQALRQIVYRGAPVVGAPLASWMLVRHGVAAAFWVCAFMFAVSVIALVATRMTRPDGDESRAGPADPRPSVLADIRDGLQLVAHDRRLLVIVVIVFILDFGLAGPTTVGVPLLAADQGWGPAGIGWVAGGFGLGAVLTALVLTRRQPVRAGAVAGVGLALMAVGLLVVGLVSSLGLTPGRAVVVAGLGGVIAGVGAGLFGTLMNAVAVAISPVGQLGRVIAAISLAGYVGDPISLSLTGAAAEGLGASSPFLIGGALLVVAVLIAVMSRAFRTIVLPAPAGAR